VKATEVRGWPAPEPERPILRGVLHLGAAVVAPFALAALVLVADSPAAYAGAAIFAASVVLLYATSAAYHVAPWPSRVRRVMMRIDHSMIFILIAGTYTPFCLVTLDLSWGLPVLAAVWSLAAAGVLVKSMFPDAPRVLGVALYLALGWSGVVAASQVITGLPARGLILLVAGGMLYSLGSVVYAMRRPDPFPRTFGYHEVFHALVVGGTAIHFTVIALYVVS